MNRSTEKRSEIGQGGVLFQLSEYLSRPARNKLVRAIFDEISFEVHEKKSFQRRNNLSINRSYTPFTEFKSLIGVTHKTASRWINGGSQACNYNADKIILAGLTKCPEKTIELLVKDLQIHQKLINRVIAELGQGDVQFQPLGVVA